MNNIARSALLVLMIGGIILLALSTPIVVAKKINVHSVFYSNNYKIDHFQRMIGKTEMISHFVGNSQAGAMGIVTENKGYIYSKLTANSKNTMSQTGIRNKGKTKLEQSAIAGSGISKTQELFDVKGKDTFAWEWSKTGDRKNTLYYDAPFTSNEYKSYVKGKVASSVWVKNKKGHVDGHLEGGACQDGTYANAQIHGKDTTKADTYDGWSETKEGTGGVQWCGNTDLTVVSHSANNGNQAGSWVGVEHGTLTVDTSTMAGKCSCKDTDIDIDYVINDDPWVTMYFIMGNEVFGDKDATHGEAYSSVDNGEWQHITYWNNWNPWNPSSPANYDKHVVGVTGGQSYDDYENVYMVVDEIIGLNPR